MSPGQPVPHRLYSVFLVAGLIVLSACAAGASGNAGGPASPTGPASGEPAERTPQASSTEGPHPTLPATNTPLDNKSPASDDPGSSGAGTPPAETPTRRVSPTPTPTAAPPSLATIPGYAIPVLQDDAPEEVEDILEQLPTPVPRFELPDHITNVVLLGTDQGGTNTDAIILVSVNANTKTATMVSIPRDMYVYIPELTRMARINTAYAGGFERLAQTILYNFGVNVHYFVQVDFAGFKQGIDLMDGVDVAVSCALRDWRLISPDLDPEVEENWEQFTLPMGVVRMDGDLALWYVRSRRTTSDFDRGRRQQQILRSMLNQGVDVGLLARLPDLWNAYRDSFRTNMDIGRMLQLASLAPAVRENGVQHLYIVGEQVRSYTVPSSGAQVQLPNWDRMQDTFRRLTLPPALNRATRPPILVEVINASGNPDMAILAADNLKWYGFEPVIGDTQVDDQAETSIQYFGENLKGSFDWLLSWVFDRNASDVTLVSDVPYEYHYRVVLGSGYRPCRPELYAPRAFLEP
jgi:polyisoprenyl-teichoic acid--peptidoglycan teichoic acid transferase